MNGLFYGIGLPGGSEWFWIFLAVVVLFGAKRIPDLARGLGRSVGEFKRAKDEFERELNNAATTPPKETASTAKPADSSKSA